MIFLHDDGYCGPARTPNHAPSAAPGAKFLFDTNERSRKSGIAATHSKQTTEFPFDTDDTYKISGIAVTRSIPTARPFSIRYKWTLRNSPALSKKIANSAVRIPRA